MVVRYLGHSCFLLNSQKGTTLILDPYGTSLPYKFPLIYADVVAITHEHKDHNADWRVGGNPIVVKRTSEFPMEHEVPVRKTGETLIFKGIPCFHDDMSGRKRGPNTILIWEMDKLRFCHLGDLGHLLNEQQLKEIGLVDVLFIPVGGKITIDSSHAALVINQILPRMIFPMHYKTGVINGLDLADEEIQSFAEKMTNVEFTFTLAHEVFRDRLPQKPQVIVLNYE